MTIEDALKSNPTFVQVPSNTLEAAAISRGVDWTDDYDSTRLQDLELISADVYMELATQPSFSEGDLSVQYDRGILTRRARNIYLKYDDAKYDETRFEKIDLNITKL